MTGFVFVGMANEVAARSRPMEKKSGKGKPKNGVKKKNKDTSFIDIFVSTTTTNPPEAVRK